MSEHVNSDTTAEYSNEGQVPVHASFRLLSIRAASEAGVPVPVVMPDGSKETIRVRSQWADEFVQRKAILQAGLPSPDELRKMTDEARQSITAMALAEARCALIAGWSFAEECNESNKLAFVMECPHIAEQIDAFAGQSGNFSGR